jgi:hypothetical protein
MNAVVAAIVFKLTLKQAMKVQRGSRSIAVFLALDGVGGQGHAAVALPRERDTVSIVQEPGCAPGLIWTRVENIAFTESRCLDRPAWLWW